VEKARSNGADTPFARMRRGRRYVRLGVVACAVGLIAALAATSAAKAGGKVMAVSQGPGAAVLPAFVPFGTTPSSTPETVSFILRARNLDQLEALVQAGMPGGYLSVSEFAGQYGQPQVVISAIQAFLAHFGIQSNVMPDDLVIQTTGTAGEYDQALQIVQQNFRLPALPTQNGRPGHPAMTIHGSMANPKVPSDWGPFILAVLGLSNYPTNQSDMIGVPSDATPDTLPNTALLPSDFATRYKLTGVHGTGAGRTIGIVTLASIKADVVSQFWSQDAGLSPGQSSVSRITPVNVDGGAGPASETVGSDETVLDAEQSGALAPDAKVRVYQAPNTDFGFVDAFFQAASENLADTVSASWGSSESVIRVFDDLGLEDPAWTASFDQAFLELAAQGQSTFLSSGDSGAYPASRDLGSTDRSAGNPDDSPWVTSSGGTTLPGPFTVHGLTFNFPTERTWGWDYLWGPRSAQLGEPEIVYAETHVVGGGGGYSSFEPMPNYQRSVRGTSNFSAVEYLKPIDFSNDLFGDPSSGVTLSFPLPWDWAFNPTPVVTQGTGTGRATPDLSADADPETGYQLLYTFGDSVDPNAPPTIEQFGGTSFVAPQLNGSAAVIDSELGHRVGLWNPAIYNFATQRNSPFTPLDASGTSNDNLYYTGTPGNVYNVGSGLGTPDLAKLAADFAGGNG